MRGLGVVAIVLTLAAAPVRAQEPGVAAVGEPPIPTEAARRSHPVKAILETGLALGLNIAVYWWDVNFNSPDWDLHWDWPSWKKKLTFKAVRLDSNKFATNAGSHSEGGTIIYLIGRGNGLTVGGSTLLTLGEVVVWEYFGEFYEKPSINDMINNPLAGMAVGEPFYQLSQFFGHGARNGVNEILASIFSPMSAVNGWSDRQWEHRSPDTDRLGLPRDIWHRFDLYAGMANAHWSDDTERSETVLGLRTQINTVPGFGRPFPRSGFFGPARYTSIDAGLSLGEIGMTGALFGTHVALAGYHAQNLRLDDDAEIAGSTMLLTLVNTFEYSNRQRPNLGLDQIATFGIIGPGIDLSHRRGAFGAALRLEALPELAMVDSLPADAYRVRYGTEGIKSELAEHGYYYGYGLSLGARLGLRFHNVEGGGDARWERFGSIEGLDRFQERLTRDIHQSDGRSRALLWLSVQPLPGFADIAVSLEHTDRWGKLADIDVSRSERRASITLGFAL
jgi:hypothetical protein